MAQAHLLLVPHCACRGDPTSRPHRMLPSLVAGGELKARPLQGARRSRPLRPLRSRAEGGTPPNLYL